MKCPNCRCIIPGSMTVCDYCGYDFLSDSTKTVSVDKAYTDQAKYYNEMSSYDSYAPYYINGQKDCDYNSVCDQSDINNRNLYINYYNWLNDDSQCYSDFGNYSGIKNRNNQNYDDSKILYDSTNYGYYDVYSADSMFISKNTLLVIAGINIVFLIIILELILLLL